MKRYLKLYISFFRNCLAREMEFRGHFLLQNFVGLLWAFVVFITFIFIYKHLDSINGWTLESMLLLTAIYFLIDRIFDSFFELNFWDLTSIVNTGKLDYILTKPISSQFYISLRRFSFAPFFSNISMIVIIIYLIRSYFLPISFLQIFQFIILLFTGLAITYSLWFISLMPIFKWGRVDNIHHLFRPFHQLCRIPLNISGKAFKFLLTFIFPLAFVTTIPTQVIVSSPSSWLVVYAVFISIVLLFLSNKTWRFCLKSYTSASS